MQLIKPLPDQTITETEQKDTIPKKLAAWELWKAYRISNVTGYVSIATLMVVAVISTFSKYGGAIAAGIPCIVYTYIIMKNRGEMSRLEIKYTLVTPKPIIEEESEAEE
jgi:hypothetical protein